MTRTKKHADLRYLPISEVADRYSVTVKTLRNHVATGRLPAFKVGGRLRIREDHAEALARPVPCAVPR